MGGVGAADCLIKCGVPTGTYALHEYAGGVKIDGAGLTQSFLACLVPCLAAVGVTTVERVIGFKRGTGGTDGVGYLRKMLDVVLFPEIWALRTDL